MLIWPQKKQLQAEFWWMFLSGTKFRYIIWILMSQGFFYFKADSKRMSWFKHESKVKNGKCTTNGWFCGQWSTTTHRENTVYKGLLARLWESSHEQMRGKGAAGQEVVSGELHERMHQGITIWGIKVSPYGIPEVKGRQRRGNASVNLFHEMTVWMSKKLNIYSVNCAFQSAVTMATCYSCLCQSWWKGCWFVDTHCQCPASLKRKKWLRSWIPSLFIFP